jgi:hypothetical protein
MSLEKGKLICDDKIHVNGLVTFTWLTFAMFIITIIRYISDFNIFAWEHKVTDTDLLVFTLITLVLFMVLIYKVLHFTDRELQPPKVPKPKYNIKADIDDKIIDAFSNNRSHNINIDSNILDALKNKN